MNKSTYNRIQKYLYNYNNIDKIINNIKLDTTDYTHYSYNNWIKSKYNLGITLEDDIIDIQNNRIILRLQKWKSVISDTLEYYKKFDNIKYQYICLKYFDKKSYEKIQNKLKLNKRQQKDMQVDILQHIFLYSVRKKLLRKNY